MAIKWPQDLKLKTAEDPDVEFCTVGGVGHDFREYTYAQYGSWHTELVCVWCHGHACGKSSEDDPCLKIRKHGGYHVSRANKAWPVGESRPAVVPS